MFYVSLTFLVLRIILQKQSPPVETTSVKCFSFLAFLLRGVYIHSVGRRDRMGYTVDMVSPLTNLTPVRVMTLSSLRGQKVKHLQKSRMTSQNLTWLQPQLTTPLIL